MLRAQTLGGNTASDMSLGIGTRGSLADLHRTHIQPASEEFFSQNGMPGTRTVLPLYVLLDGPKGSRLTVGQL
jgi:hypothetical protein